MPGVLDDAYQCVAVSFKTNKTNRTVLVFSNNGIA